MYINTGREGAKKIELNTFQWFTVREPDGMCKLKHGRSCLNISKYFFTVRVTEHWYRLAMEAVASPSIETFKSCLDTVLGN